VIRYGLECEEDSTHRIVCFSDILAKELCIGRGGKDEAVALAAETVAEEAGETVYEGLQAACHSER